MTKIFISYRRTDSGYVADTLCEKLQARFGAENVFFDIDSIPLGVDFREHISDAVGQCDVLLAIIGDTWLDAKSKKGGRRIDDPADYVRIEIEAALKRGIPIVPILIGNATMPPESDLPLSVGQLVYRNACELRSGRDYRGHMERLIKGLEKLGESTPLAKPKTAAKKTEKPKPPPEVPPAQEEPPKNVSWREFASVGREFALGEDEFGLPQLRLPTSRKPVGPVTQQEIKAYLGHVWDLCLSMPPETDTWSLLNTEPVPTMREKVLLSVTGYDPSNITFYLTPFAVCWGNDSTPMQEIEYQDIHAVKASLSPFRLSSYCITINGETISLPKSVPKETAEKLAGLIETLASRRRPT